MEKSLLDFVYGCGCDIEFAFDKARELQNIIDEEAEKLAKEKEESLFNAHKEEFQLEVLEKLQKDGIRKAGMELSSTSPLISEKFTVNGVTLYASDYIPDSVAIDPIYEDNILVKNQYSLEYQEINNKNGKRKFAWKETPTLVLISNPTAAGKCENVVCYLKGNPKPLVFPNGEITLEAFRRQTTFARKGINISVHKQYESFLRSLREYPQKKFLTIPKHAGGITLPNGVTMYISSDSVISGLPVLQRLSGMFDYAFKEYIYNNPDAARQLVHDGIEAARHIVSNFRNVDITDTMIMTLATAHILKRLGIVTESDFKAIIHWFKTEATSRLSMSDSTCCEFKSAVSNAILNGELKIAKQTEPPYYKEDSHTAFIREEDKSINMSDDTIKNIIIPQISTRSVTRMNKHLNQKGWLKGKYTNKRKLRVAYEAGVFDDTEVFSYSRSVLNAEAKDYVDDIIDNEYWFNVSEYPEGFVPILYNADGTRAAGYVFEPDMDDNLHEVYFGATRSGKTFALTHRAISRVCFESANAVIIFDQTGGFTPNEVAKHIGKELTESYFSFWDVYQDGIPVVLLDLRGCLTLKDERERILRIYVMMTRMLGTYQEQILKVAVNCMVKQMKRNLDLKIADILKFIEGTSYNDDGELVMDEAHKKLYLKLKSVIDDFEDTPQNKNNWGEFVKSQDKPIIVISTGADSVGKGSEIIDVMLESLYSYKQCYPDSRYTVVIDEAQDLYLHEKGAVNTLLRKGGKHGVAMLMASQSFPDPTTQFGKVVGNCGRVRGYRSKGNDLARYAERFGCYKDEADLLQKGNCFDNGQFWSRYRRGNVIKTLKGKTVAFEIVPDINNNDEQPYGCSRGGEHNG